MTRSATFILFFMAIFLQSGAYGLTFMLPDLFALFGENEKTVGQMLGVTTVSTLVVVYYSGHLADRIGRVHTLGFACFMIAFALVFYGMADQAGPLLILASLFLGAGWGLTYALGPVVLTGLVRAQERVRFFALLSLFVMAGFGLAPVLASFLLDIGYSIRASFWIVGGLSALSGILFFFLAGPIKNHQEKTTSDIKSKLTLRNIFEIMQSPARLPVVMVFLGASVFAGMTNFQTSFAAEKSLNYSHYFLVYTTTVIAFRILLVGWKGGKNPYLTIAILQFVMGLSVVLFWQSGTSDAIYILVAILFGIGYGGSYPILVAVTANDANAELSAQTLQLFALTYFVGIFGFPLVAGWLFVTYGASALLILTALLAFFEASLALRRAFRLRRDI